MKNFNDIYEKIYKKAKKPLEEIRKTEIVKKILILVSIFIVSIFLLLKFRIIFIIVPFLVPLIVLLLCFVFLKTGNEYNQIFKCSVIRSLVEECNENLKYNQYGGTSASIYRNADFERFDRFKSEDNISGMLKDGYKINICEVHTQKREKSKDSPTVYRTLFRGLFVYLDIDKYIRGKIKITRNKNIKVFDMNEYLMLDSAEFEEIYDVYCNDKIISMQILTADTMQMLIDFKKKYNIAPEFTIKGNKLYIRLETGNIFEGNILEESVNYDTLKRYYNAINCTLEITEKILKTIQETEI